MTGALRTLRIGIRGTAGRMDMTAEIRISVDSGGATADRA